MQPFITHRGILAPLDRANVDTDQIMAKQFLKSIERTGFGPHLFHDWRYLADGSPNPDFILNQKPYDKATLLVTRNNFGCGSSREHAVWGVQQFGFRAVIAPWIEKDGARIGAFADIFRNNSFKNGLLLIELSPSEVDALFALVESEKGAEATVDLEKEILTVHAKNPATYRFSIDPAIRGRLLKGLDDIGITLEKLSAITHFEKRHDVFLP